MPKAVSWTDDWTVGVRVWVARAGETLLGEGRADLLAAIDRLHSITKAAKAVGISYRKAWALVQDANAAAGVPLVEAAVGGIQGGGARLTPQGKLALEVYGQLRAAVYNTAAGMLQRIVNPADDAASCLHVAAAISVQEVVGQLLAEYALERPTVRVRAIYGASNELADHLLAGAPADIFISADAVPLNRLDDARLIAASSRRTLAHNALTIVGSNQINTMRKAADLLDRKIQRVAIAEPQCPLGMCSRAYLRAEKIYDSLKPKLLEVDNSRAVLSAVDSGAAEVGLAFASDAARSNHLKTLLRIPPAKAGAEYSAAIVSRSSTQAKKKPAVVPAKKKLVGIQQSQQPQQTEAQRLFDFLTSTAAARTFRRCGFRPSEDL